MEHFVNHLYIFYIIFTVFNSLYFWLNTPRESNVAVSRVGEGCTTHAHTTNFSVYGRRARFLYLYTYGC